MMVAGEYALDLRISPNDPSQFFAACEQANSIHMLDPAGEWRMVQADDRRAIAVRAEFALEKSQRLARKFAMARALNETVEADQPQRAGVRGEVERAASPEIAERRESRAHRFAAVVIAGNDMNRTGQPIEKREQDRIFLIETAVGGVASQDHDIGRGAQSRQRMDRAFSHDVRFRDAISQLSRWANMKIGYLRDQQFHSSSNRRTADRRFRRRPPLAVELAFGSAPTAA